MKETDNIEVSVIIPCLNEATFIETVIRNILEQDFPINQMEVLFVDGGSTDDTQKIIRQYSATYKMIKLLSNPNRYVPYAMNTGIKMASANIIVRLDAHAAYPSNYISKLVYWLKKLNADNVGGLWEIVARNNTAKANAIASVLAHPFGVGNATYRLGATEPTEVDTVPFGCFPKSTFEKYGLYDLRLNRNQDIELNKRIIRAGGKIVLVPEISCTYFARDTYAALWKNNFENGKWVILTARYTKTFNALSIRHFIPLFFVIYLILAIAFLLKWILIGLANWAFIIFIPFLLYLLLISLASVQIAIKKKRFSLFLPALVSFFVLHISYGIGSIVGVWGMINLK